jgi:gamma-glutamyltranspeptidase / glutathione hydrolase
VTDRWLNYALAIVVVVGMAAVTVYERPRLAEERAELLGQEVARIDEPQGEATARRTPWEQLQSAPRRTAEAEERTMLDGYGVSASHPAAVEVGKSVLEAGGNAVDAAIAVSYALGVVEPFGSGIGGGGALLVHEPGEEPRAYDYRETAPSSGELPASNIGVPGFVAGMEQVHADYGTIDLPELIEPAARLAEDGVEVSGYLHDRLLGAGHRLPIHLAPRLFPNGQAIGAGEMLHQPEYAQALRLIQDQGADVMYGGELAERIVEAVSGLEMVDFEDYEVMEVEPAVGSFAGYEVIGAGTPTSGPTVVQILQVAEELGITDADLASADAHHAIAQSWRVALSDRTQHLADPAFDDVPVEGLVSEAHAERLAASIPSDGFADVEEQEAAISPEADTTHLVVVDRSGTMVSVTNTLSNFFGSGLPVSGFFLNDQLKNFSQEPDSVNHVGPGKRPRSFIAPTIVAQDDRPLLGLGSPGGRRIPMMIAQVLIRWAGHGEDLEAAIAAPRFHLEGQRLEIEQPLGDDVAADLNGRGYEVTMNVPTTEYFGGIQALRIDPDAAVVEGVADDRRIGAWDAHRD